jgi:hypothetical protein
VLTDAWIEIVRPTWLLLAIAGAFWAAAFSAVVPPPLRGVGWVFLAGLTGAAAGQYLAAAASLRELMLGDAHLLEASVGALLAVVVVRRLVA